MRMFFYWTIIYIFTFMIGIWSIDVAVSAMSNEQLVNGYLMNMGSEYKIVPSMSNGWFYRTPLRQYHIGLYISLFSTLFYVVYISRYIFNKQKSFIIQSS